MFLKYRIALRAWRLSSFLWLGGFAFISQILYLLGHCVSFVSTSNHPATLFLLDAVFPSSEFPGLNSLFFLPLYSMIHLAYCPQTEYWGGCGTHWGASLLLKIIVLCLLSKPGNNCCKYVLPSFLVVYGGNASVILSRKHKSLTPLRYMLSVCFLIDINLQVTCTHLQKTLASGFQTSSTFYILILPSFQVTSVLV